jgi:hypothetical protein
MGHEVGVSASAPLPEVNEGVLLRQLGSASIYSHIRNKRGPHNCHHLMLGNASILMELPDKLRFASVCYPLPWKYL